MTPASLASEVSVTSFMEANSAFPTCHPGIPVIGHLPNVAETATIPRGRQNRGLYEFLRRADFRSVGARNAIETAFQWLLQPYSCSLCGRRFFLFRWLVPVGGTA